MVRYLVLDFRNQVITMVLSSGSYTNANKFIRRGFISRWTHMFDLGDDFRA